MEGVFPVWPRATLPLPPLLDLVETVPAESTEPATALARSLRLIPEFAAEGEDGAKRGETYLMRHTGD